jgi:hypothetical protein
VGYVDGWEIDPGAPERSKRLDSLCLLSVLQGTLADGGKFRRSARLYISGTGRGTFQSSSEGHRTTGNVSEG